ncbi:MAG: armadillo-type protein [Podila humilis]|nr:MAG: armadillo-type protein [Podila humilis]
MDFPQVLAAIEKACAETQHPSTRAAADQVLINFKQSPNILPACQYILANSKTPFVQFQAASGITAAIVREYGLYSKSDIHSLQEYLITYNLQHPTLPWVSRQIYQAIAVVSKRGWLEGTEQEQDVVYNQISHLLSMGNHEREAGLLLARALVDEFSSRGKASNVGLTWDFHYKTKNSFEERHLRLIFEAALNVLHSEMQDLLSNPAQEVSGTQKPLLSTSLIILESILHWDFSTSSQPVLAGTFADEDDDTDKVVVYPDSWRTVLVNAEVLKLFFTLLPMVQADTILMHRVRQCLIQLCGLHGSIFVSEEATIHHISGVMTGLLSLIHNVATCSSDECLRSDYTDNMIAITEMIRQLLSYHPIHTIYAVPEKFEFLNQVAGLTIHCLDESAKMPEESESIMGAFDELLVTWVKLVQDSQNTILENNSTERVAAATSLLQFFHSISYRIVEKYIDTRLELAKFSVMDEEEGDGFQDWDTYGDQLIAITALARLDPQNTLHRLQNLLHGRVEKFQQFLNTTTDGDLPEHISFLLEHLHWLIVITGFVFADNNVGEGALVPEALNELSKTQPFEQDQLVNIFSNLMSLLSSVSFESHSVQSISCSPQIALSLFWFLERWVKAYLFSNPEDYGSLSPNLLHAYGEPSHGGKGVSILEFLIAKLRINFVMWNADPDVLSQIIILRD